MDINMKRKNVAVTADDYAKKFLTAIGRAKTVTERMNIINKIYSDGFEDGFNNQ